MSACSQPTSSSMALECHEEFTVELTAAECREVVAVAMTVFVAKVVPLPRAWRGRTPLSP